MSFISSLKGKIGETVINVAMWVMLDKKAYHRLNNITLPLPDGGSTQIDHVIVSIYGIFVIETKHYKGWIFGSEEQAQWTQVVFGKKYKFQNPLRQNYLHIKTLSDLLGLDSSHFHSIIAFTGECKIKTRDELPEHVLTRGMVPYIKMKQDKILTEAQVQAIVEQIEAQRFDRSWRTNAQHNAYIADKKALNSSIKSNSKNTKSQKLASTEMQTPSCPKCNSAMIERIAKKGTQQGQAFYGCSQFPKCRGTVNID